MTILNIWSFMMAGSIEIMLLEQYFCRGLNLKKKEWFVILPALAFVGFWYDMNLKMQNSLVAGNLFVFFGMSILILAKYGRKNWTKCFYVLEASALYSVLIQCVRMMVLLMSSRPVEDIENITDGIRSAGSLFFVTFYGLFLCGCIYRYRKFKQQPQLTAQLQPVDFWLFYPAALLSNNVTLFCSALRQQPEVKVHYTFSFLIAGIAFNVFMLLYLTNKRKQSYYKEQAMINRLYLTQQLEYFAEYKKSQEDVRRFRHDVNNHFTCIRELFDTGRERELALYMKNMTDYLEDVSFPYHTGNNVADAVLSAKYQLMQKEYITFQCEGQFRMDRLPEPMDLCAMLANALDNAIEESKKVQYPKERFISLEIRNTLNYMIITLKNRYNEKPPIRFNRLLTSKGDDGNHGYGLENIRQCVQRYGGSMEICADEEFFILELIL